MTFQIDVVFKKLVNPWVHFARLIYKNTKQQTFGGYLNNTIYHHFGGGRGYVRASATSNIQLPGS